MSLGVVSLSQASEIVHVPDDVNEILGVFPEGSLTVILRAKEEMDSRLGGTRWPLEWFRTERPSSCLVGRVR